ncbi:hypothetical protein Fot_10500 [Forsythia ovata]|uniref:Uncharacterized protein n=1 Tax=Forsythia ovata TaxID=205694 RepID=A0ABD1WH01_9LAMI
MGMENEGETVGVECEMEIDGKAIGVDSQMENDGNVAGVDGAYVPQFNENTDCNIDVEWESFLDRHQYDIWNSWEDGLGMTNEEKPQPEAESEEYEVQTEGFQEGFVDSDFEYEGELILTQDLRPFVVNVDLGMDGIAGQQGNDIDTQIIHPINKKEQLEDTI